MVLEDSSGPTDNISYDGDGYDHDQYYIGRSFPNGLGGVTFSMHGELSQVGVWNRGLTAAEIESLSQVSFDTSIPNLVGYWPLMQSSGSSTPDDGPSGFDGTLEGDASWLARCFDEDFDEDGIPALEDCDDSDPTQFALESGTGPTCAASSCKSILDNGHSTGDGVYWINPAGNDSFEMYCDMTNDGGGWTSVYGWTFGSSFPSADIFFSNTSTSYSSPSSLNMALEDIPSHTKVRIRCSDDAAYKYIGIGSLSTVSSSCGRYSTCWTLSPDNGYNGNLYGWHHSIESTWTNIDESGSAQTGGWMWNIYPTNGVSSDCGSGNPDTNPTSSSFFAIEVQ